MCLICPANRFLWPDALFGALSLSELVCERNSRERGNSQKFSILDINSRHSQRRRCSTKEWNSLLKYLHKTLKRGKILRDHKFLGNSDLIGLDGTGQYNSAKISCPKCMDRVTLNCVQSCHHQLLAVQTNKRATYSLPIYFEPIDNTTIPTYDKNDCELNTCKH